MRGGVTGVTARLGESTYSARRCQDQIGCNGGYSAARVRGPTGRGRDSRWYWDCSFATRSLPPSGARITRIYHPGDRQTAPMLCDFSATKHDYRSVCGESRQVHIYRTIERMLARATQFSPLGLPKVPQLASMRARRNRPNAVTALSSACSGPAPGPAPQAEWEQASATPQAEQKVQTSRAGKRMSRAARPSPRARPGPAG